MTLDADTEILFVLVLTRSPASLTVGRIPLTISEPSICFAHELIATDHAISQLVLNQSKSLNHI